MELEDQIAEKRRAGWIEAAFAIEALGANADVVKRSLETHMQKMQRAPDSLFYESTLEEAREVALPKPIAGLEKGWSAIARCKLFTKDLYTLLNLIYLYGPSSVEILGPESKELSIAEMQNIANTLAGLIHQYAAAGIGGIVLPPR